jgi:hypothetical protein
VNPDNLELVRDARCSAGAQLGRIRELDGTVVAVVGYQYQGVRALSVTINMFRGICTAGAWELVVADMTCNVRRLRLRLGQTGLFLRDGWTVC